MKYIVYTVFEEQSKRAEDGGRVCVQIETSRLVMSYVIAKALDGDKRWTIQSMLITRLYNFRIFSNHGINAIVVIMISRLDILMFSSSTPEPPT